MTFKELYQQTKEQPSPAQVFIREIADATCREESTVRQWLSGTQVPTAKAKERIADILDKPVSELFPPEEMTNDNDNGQ